MHLSNIKNKSYNSNALNLLLNLGRAVQSHDQLALDRRSTSMPFPSKISRYGKVGKIKKRARRGKANQCLYNVIRYLEKVINYVTKLL